MKNIFKGVGTQGIKLCAIAMIAIIGLSFAACSNGSTDNPSGDNIDHLVGTWKCDSPDVEFELTKGKYENYFTSSDVGLGLYARVFVLNGDVITVHPGDDPDGTFKVLLGNDEKLTVSDGTGDFADEFNGVYTKQ